MDIKEKLKNAICNNDIEFLKENEGLYSIDERFYDENNDTLLLYSISDESSNIYSFLLKNGANISLLNDEGENVLHAVVFSGDNERLEKIITEYTLDIDHQSKDGATPLLLAISLEKIEIAISLIKYGANVNLADNNGISPLHLASQLQDLNFVKILLNNGADLFLKTDNGNLPMALAVNSNNTEVIKLLFEKMYS